jgi:hypothetical protein
MFDPEFEKWTIVSDFIVGSAPLPRFGHAISLVGSTQYIFGGSSEQGIFLFYA